MTSKLRVAFPSLPKIEELDFAQARTLDVHQILLQLIGAPLFSWVSHLENVYADKVVASEDFKVWTVHFRKEAKFSDGSPLEAAHWYHSVARTIRLGAGVHFNPKKDLVGGDKTKDGYCEGLILQGDQVQLRLKEANKNFPRLLGKVEATVLSEKDQYFRLDILKNPGSGPYTLESYSGSQLLLKLNPHFPAHKGRAQFKQIAIHKMDDHAAFEARIKDKMDFIFPTQQPSVAERANLEKTSQIYRDFGHTYFIGFRAKKQSPWIENEEYRNALAAILSKLPPFEAFERTDTLIIGEGLGRLPNGPTFKSRIKELPPLSIATVDKPVNRHIIDFLASNGVTVNMIWANAFNEIYSGKSLNSDAIIGWNDFCAEDPYIALYNALNPDRPLWADEDGKFRSELTKIQALNSVSEKDMAYQGLHKQLLESALVVPFFKVWFDAFAAKSLNLGPMKGSALWTIGI